MQHEQGRQKPREVDWKEVGQTLAQECSMWAALDEFGSAELAAVLSLARPSFHLPNAGAVNRASGWKGVLETTCCLISFLHGGLQHPPFRVSHSGESIL